ncbi:MAG: SURF1 family protein [Steroidobacteraceae bacterium]
MDHLSSKRQHDAGGYEPDALSADHQPRPARSPLALSLLGLLCLLTVAALTALGIWQLERRVWKLNLIGQITQRVHAAPIAAPGPSQWPQVTAGDYAYRRVRVAGQYLNDRETLVHAVTRLGGGFWVLTPLRTAGGFTVLVNRGFVPPERRDVATRTAGLISDGTVVSGLLRVTEPKGAFLHANNPAADRWYSRDVAAIAAARSLSPIAPYFIDADATPVPGGLPVGGLTVIELPNNHLVYALTWFTLAVMLAGAAAYAGREEWRHRP